MWSNAKCLMVIVTLVLLACLILGCGGSKPEHSAGLTTKEESVASEDWKYRERAKLPEYFHKHLQEKTKEIEAVYSKNRKDKELLVFFTDYHIEENQGFSPLLIKELDKQFPISLVAFGGDIYDYGPSKEAAWQKMENFHKRFAFIRYKMFGAIGNHEFNTSLGNRKKHPENKINSGELLSKLLRQELATCGASNAYGDYWLDRQNLRVFFLGASSKQILEDGQYDWFFSELERIPNGKKVLLVSHLGCGNAEYKGTVDKPMLPVIQALGALKSGTDFVWKNRSYAYKDKMTEVIGCLSGHVHKDDMTKAYDVTVIATARDALRFDNEKKIVRKPGTISEQVLDVVVIDKAQRKVDLIRIGYGKNRSFTY